jgi:hypothetical protein
MKRIGQPTSKGKHKRKFHQAIGCQQPVLPVTIPSDTQKDLFAVPHNLLRDLTEQVFMAYYLQPTRGGMGHENPKRILPEKANCVHL